MVSNPAVMRDSGDIVTRAIELCLSSVAGAGELILSGATLGNLCFQDVGYHFQIKTWHHDQSARLLATFTI
jgi:hypothetical protein